MWYYTLNNQQYGPVDEAKMKELAASGVINASTFVWTQGMAAWAPISQTALASQLGNLPPAPPAYYAPAAVAKDPEVEKNDTLFMWFWISLIGILLFGIGLIPAAVLFFILIYRSWKAVQHEGVRGNPDKMTAFCFIPGWNFYWMFPAFRGLAKEFNDMFIKENIAQEPFNLDLVTWMLICLFASGITFGLSAIAFIVLWIIYTSKVKNALNAVVLARKA
jgi:hypothetical protein